LSVFLSIIFDASVFLVRLMDEYELKEGKTHLKLLKSIRSTMKMKFSL